LVDFRSTPKADVANTARWRSPTRATSIRLCRQLCARSSLSAVPCRPIADRRPRPSSRRARVIAAISAGAERTPQSIPTPSFSRTQPSQPRASPRGRGLACDPHAARRPASIATGYRSFCDGHHRPARQIRASCRTVAPPNCEEACGTEGEIVKASVAAAALALIIAMALATAAASVSAKSPTSSFHASVIGGGQLVPVW
jgi:hypothetical protein